MILLGPKYKYLCSFELGESLFEAVECCRFNTPNK